MTQDLRGDYQVQLIHPSGHQLDLLEMNRVVSLNYSRVLNDYGTFTLTVKSDDDIAEYFGLTDMVVNIWRKNQPLTFFALDASYFCRFWSRLENSADKTEYLVFSGYQLEHALKRRVIRTEDDPVSAGGYLTRNGSADQVMVDFVTYQMVSPAVNADRIFTGLTVQAATGGFSNSFQRRISANLLDVLKEISVKGAVDFEIAYTGDAETETMSMEFRAGRIGTDRTFSNNYPTSDFLLFDPKRGNMFNPTITINRKDEVTFAYVAGQGAEDARVVFPVINPAEINASIWNRIEVMKDARNNEENDVDGLLSAGLEALNEQRLTTDFDFTPNLEVALYNVDWFLGDSVTAQYENYMRDVRISRVTLDVNEDETITIELQNRNIV